mmetsp:Transcript_8867/g.10134  ORF Transcript_8867/g.10134 Transcript_8867/m.10134 type:complete len:102 (-) Transcript_8867:122-427(-)
MSAIAIPLAVLGSGFAIVAISQKIHKRKEKRRRRKREKQRIWEAIERNEKKLDANFRPEELLSQDEAHSFPSSRSATIRPLIVLKKIDENARESRNRLIVA